MRLSGGEFATEAASNCIGVLPNASYDFVAMAKTLPGGGLSRAHAVLAILWYSDPSCNANPIQQNVLNADAISGWRQLGASAISPAGVQSAKVDVVAGNGGFSSFIDLYVDDVRFGMPGTVPVTVQSFDVE